jgi:hypothetical protein
MSIYFAEVSGLAWNGNKNSVDITDESTLEQLRTHFQDGKTVLPILTAPWAADPVNSIQS